MSWLINNSDVIVGVVALLFVIIVTVIKFLLMSRDKQLEKVKELLIIENKINAGYFSCIFILYIFYYI